jgi:hypothetical protein
LGLSVQVGQLQKPSDVGQDVSQKRAVDEDDAGADVEARAAPSSTAARNSFRFMLSSYSYQQPVRLTVFQEPQKTVWPGLSVQVGHPQVAVAGLPAQ